MTYYDLLTRRDHGVIGTWTYSPPLCSTLIFPEAAYISASVRLGNTAVEEVEENTIQLQTLDSCSVQSSG